MKHWILIKNEPYFNDFIFMKRPEQFFQEEKLFKDKMPGIIAYLEKHKDQVFESHRSELEKFFSLKVLEHLAEKSDALRADVEALITVSRLYAEVVSMLDDEVVIQNNIMFEGLLKRQKEAHDRFEEVLRDLYIHAREQQDLILFDISRLSRVRSLQIALFIAYQDIIMRKEAQKRVAA